MNTGIYIILNLITGAYYIGSAARGFTRRWNEHRNMLHIGKHHNHSLQSDWKFYGEPSFRFSVLEECPPGRCIEREQHFIDVFDPCYNILKIAGSVLGYRHTQETRAKIGLIHKDLRHTPEARAKIGASLIGNKRRLGSHPTAATRDRMSSAHIGHHHTQEARAKISLARKGMQLTPESKAKISRANKGRHPSPETRAKISVAMRGYRHSLGFYRTQT